MVGATVHMGGRIYDPTLGRFMQADPIVQAPGNSQSYNRFAYVFNNPMSYTDPSGTGFVAGGVATGSLRGALVGALTGTMFGNLHGVEGAEGVIGHAFTGGISSVLNGGKFGHGFFSAGFTKSLGGVFEKATTTAQRTSNAIKAAIIGGTASRLTGGKFANGAVTGAFSRMLNDDAAAPKDNRENVNWKKFESELKRLNTMDAYDVFKEAGFTDAQIQSEKLVNACATRVSLALNNAGAPILSGGDYRPAGTRVYVGVNSMEKYLTDTYGPADITWTGDGGLLTKNISKTM